jgi:hypothetical protein
MSKVPLRLNPRPDAGLGHSNCSELTLVSHKVFLKPFCKSLFLQKSVNLFFILVIVKDKLTDLWGS